MWILRDELAKIRKPVDDTTSSAFRTTGGNNVKRAIALAAAGKLKGKELVTHRFPLVAISEGLRVLRERIGDPLKVVFVP